MHWRYGTTCYGLVVSILLVSFTHADEVVFGNVRVQTLTPRLIRVENAGPQGFENRTTFMVVNRDFVNQVPIQSVTKKDGGVVVQTQFYSVFVAQSEIPTDACYSRSDVDVDDAARTPSYPNGTIVNGIPECCSACQKDEDCTGWVYDDAAPDDGMNCWPLNAWSTTREATDRYFGCIGNTCFSVITKITVTDPKGNVLLDHEGEGDSVNMLHWPSPLSDKGYIISDFPRFFVPKWGPTPQSGIPNPDTNGYDFSNNQNGDFYIFLLGDSLSSYFSARSDFVQLVGPTPVIPDFAYGTWFTYWHSYTEKEAKNDVFQWKNLGLPLNVYGLDMNWRNTSDFQDRFYNHPNTALFANLTEWFEFLHSNGLKTYFNDHPFPVDMQTSPAEVGFRFGGLSEWMARGLDYWWFDHNWGFSIPPPNVLPIGGWSQSLTDGNWLGLDNAAWGSHVYFESVAQFYASKKNSASVSDSDTMRPITLTKFARPDWREDMPSILHQEHPSHHRFPVWWTGDGVTLKASVQSMVDSGVHDFKPFVHSDCGGDYRGTSGTILRFHGEDHRVWTYDDHTVQTVKKYLQIRYSLIPSFISAGNSLLFSGFPIVGRGDLFFPEFPESSDNTQYIHLNDTLVAPIWNSDQNVTSRSVWIPPGMWQDSWDGTVVSGPQTITVSQPFERIPMWHKRGTFSITVTSQSLRVEDQNWDQLNFGNAARTDLEMETVTLDGISVVSFRISEAEDGSSRGWNVRLHLLPNQICCFCRRSRYFIKHFPFGSRSAWYNFLSIWRKGCCTCAFCRKNCGNCYPEKRKSKICTT